MTHYIDKLRRSAAEILAAAVFEMFPGVELRGGAETYSGFFYDFFFPHPIHPELHLQIEEKMRQIVREKREIKDLEMVGTSAKAFLKSLNLTALAKQVEGSALFSLVQIGSFVDLSSGIHVKNSAEIACFKLFPPILLEEKGMRILGAAEESKENLKEFLKKNSAYAKKRHEVIGAAKGFWRIQDEGVVWLPEGLKAREKMTSCLKENLFPGALELSGPKSVDRLSFHKKILQEMGLETVLEVFDIEGFPDEIEPAGFFDPVEGKKIQITTSFKNVISLLQSIRKTLNILGFTLKEIQLSGSKRHVKGATFLKNALNEQALPFQEVKGSEGFPRIDFIVLDGLGRPWSFACVTAQESLYLEVIVERNLGFLLEL